jgi:hypothetical protein
MKFRLARLSVLLLPILGMLAATAAPADALITIGGAVIQGRATVAAGLSYPCVSNGGPDLTKCPPPVGAGNGPLGVSFTGSGVAQVDSVNKKGCTAPVDACVEVGTITVNATGSVNGWCGLSTGTLTGTITAAPLPVANKAKNRTFTVTFTGVGGALILTGTTGKGENIDGAVAAVPDAVGGSSCTNKAAKAFIVAGIVNIWKVNP